MPTVKTRLALLWHMHQPCYRDPISGELALPWVRLHATRAYFDMAWLLERHPAIQATFNFVPVLIDQLEAFTGGERDRYFSLSMKPARLLDTGERRFLLKQFFSVDHTRHVAPRARYASLLARRDESSDPARFTDADFRDLQVLFNLVWFGFAARVEYPLLSALDRKGQGFTEDEKRKLLDLQLAVARRVLPTYRRLEARGQIELTASPYNHPILPLLIDSECAERCAPDRPRPPRFAFPDDARLQVERARTRHAEVFGAAPAGMWPAEGAVSPEAAALFAESGTRWIATDEAQLWASLGQPEPTALEDRAPLYTGYRVGEAGAQIDIVFRDRQISDAIGFTYSRNTAEQGVNDLVSRLEAIAAVSPGALVTVALDGENPWEHYPDSGQPFLELLYQTLERSETLTTTRLGPALHAAPPKDTLDTLHSGSWINGDFGIWLGGAVENRAWAALGEARAYYARAASKAEPGLRARALDWLLEAEGSDWFWWYGEPFSSDNDADFDHLFRARLRAVYAAFGADAPAGLSRSLYPDAPSASARAPQSFISPSLRGPSTYFDWKGAGEIDLSAGQGSMYRSTRLAKRLLFGFDLQHLYLRIEPDGSPDWSQYHLVLRLHGETTALLEADLEDPDSATLTPAAGTSTPARVRLERGAIELAIPFEDVGLSAGQAVRMSVHLSRGAVEIARYPMGREVLFEVPDAGFESAQWTA